MENFVIFLLFEIEKENLRHPILGRTTLSLLKTIYVYLKKFKRNFFNKFRHIGSQIVIIFVFILKIGYTC